jgi:proteasome lid subunit RPN8/RPN11
MEPAPPRVFLSAFALAAIRAHGYTDTAHECGGVMVGEKLEGGEGPVVLVEAVIAGAHTDNRRGSVTFTHETWEHINQEKDQKYSDLRIVGWYHTHPGFGIFLSDYDQFIQANFFDLPWNVAFVLDPLSGESGAFGWVEGKIARLPEYEAYAVADEHPARPSAEGVAQASQPAPEEARPEPDAGLEACATPAACATPTRRPIRWGVVAAALGAVLLLGLIAAWVAGTYLLVHKPPPPAAGLPHTMRGAPAPAAPAVAPPANTVAPAPPAEATPPPGASNKIGVANQISASPKESPHEPASGEKPGL